MFWLVIVLWAIFLLVSPFYTQRVKSPDAKPLAAYMIFVTVFSTVAFLIYRALATLIGSLGNARLLEQPLFAVMFTLIIFVPAFFAARWQLEKKPRQLPLPN